MKVDRYIYCTSYGVVWRFGRAKFRAMMVTAAAGREVHFSDYGKQVAVIDHNITDLDAEQAKGWLDYEGAAK